MANRAILGIAALASGLLFNEASASASQSWCEVPFELHNQLILVKGSVGKMAKLRFVIDTGATHTVVDKRLAERLGLKPEPEEHPGRAFGQIIKLRKVFLNGLRIGQLLTSIHCYEADLSELQMGLDGIIGLDLLQRRTAELVDCETQQVLKGKNLTIDYESRKIRFGQTQSLEHAVPMEISDSRIVVVAKIQGQPARLVVDTGFPVTTLFKDRQKRWIDLPTFNEAIGFHLGGAAFAHKVLLERFELGTGRWEDLPALILDAQDQPTDGVLAVAPLNLKILHFDFERNILSWRENK